MAQYTNNFNLLKPELTDAADITKMNGNWDIVDQRLKLNDTKVTELEQEVDSKIGNLDVYSKSEVNNLLSPKANKSEVESALASKANTSDLSAKAPLASPTFTGTPKAPTASSGTNTTQIATTAFVMNEVKDKVTQTTMNNAIETAVAPTLRVVRPTIGNLAEGSIIQIIEDGTPVDFCVAKHNYEGTGRTLVVRKAHSSTVTSFANTATNKYESSRLDTFLNETYITRLDSKVQSALAEVPIEVTGKQSSTVYTINRKIFELSATEYGLSVSEGATLGSVLPVATSILPEKGSNGNSTWSRTAIYTTSGDTYVVNKTDGAVSAASTSSLYYQPAFTLPSDYSYSDEPTIVGDGKVFELATKDDFDTISNQYVWEKYKDETMLIPAYANKTQFYLYSSKYKSYTFGKNFTMSADGTYTVTETFTPSQTPINSNQNYWMNIYPFYFKDDTGAMYRATGWYTGYDTYIMVNVNKMTSKSVTSKVNYGYVSSNLPNAYPISDGFNYEPLGRFGGIGHSVTGAIVYDSVFTSEHDVVLGFRPKAVFVEDMSGIRQYSSNTDKYGGFTIDGYSQIHSYLSSDTPYKVEFLKITDYGFQMMNYAVSGTTGYRYKYYIAFR